MPHGRKQLNTGSLSLRLLYSLSLSNLLSKIDSAESAKTQSAYIPHNLAPQITFPCFIHNIGQRLRFQVRQCVNKEQGVHTWEVSGPCE